MDRKAYEDKIRKGYEELRGYPPTKESIDLIMGICCDLAKLRMRSLEAQANVRRS